MDMLIDFETRSRADLIATGQHAYARHESTEVMCIGWKIIGEPDAHVISYPAVYTNDASETKEFYYAQKHARLIVAHNAPFEQAVYNHVLQTTTPMAPHLRDLVVEDWFCTLATAAVLALPQGLERLGEALGLDIKKDMEGRKLLLQMCKPRRPIQNIGKWIEWVEDDPALKRLYQYCKTDLYSEEQAFQVMKQVKPWTKKERELWVLDQKINQRGIRVDLPLVETIMKMIEQEESQLTSRLQYLTFGSVKSAKSPALKTFLTEAGLVVPNMQKKTIDDLTNEVDLRVKMGDVSLEEPLEVLKIRQNLSKASTSKYQAFLDRVDTVDNRIRDNLRFHGASTGRWAGAGVQPQNFPRGTVKMSEEIYEDLAKGILDDIRMFHGRPMDVFSSALRGMFIASEGKELFVADFNAIEARVLLWLAGDVDGLKEYEKGLDVYKTMASVIYGVPYDQVTDDQRQVGKKVILACGYQMGLKKFAQTCKDEGIDLPESLIRRAHTAFRTKYPLVPKIWSNYEKAALYAVQNKGKRVTINKCQFYFEGDFLFIGLPSGRKLSYYKPEIRNDETSWGDVRPVVHSWGIDSKTKQWCLQSHYGGKWVENVTQAVARDCMAEGMVNVENGGYPILLSVHDELICERDKNTGDVKEFERLMGTMPAWANGLPLKVKGWKGERYRK